MENSMLMGARLIEKGHYNMENIKELSDDDIENISVALSYIGQFNASYSLYEICNENYLDIEEFFGRLSTLRGFNQLLLHKTVININQVLLNYLSSFRTFIDHQETNLAVITKEEHEWFNLFKKRTSFHFDTNFSYRFLWKLRNYTQHCGLPLGGFHIGFNQDKDSGDQLEHSIWFNRDTLLFKFDDWGIIKSDLQDQPEKIIVIDHIEQLHTCITDLATFAAKIHILRMGNHWNSIVGLLNEVSNKFPDAEPIIGNFNNDGNFTGFTQLPLLDLTRIQEILNTTDVFDILK